MRRVSLAPVIIVCALVLTATGWIDPVHDRNEQGMTLYERGRFDDAGEKFRRLRGSSREPAVVHFNLGCAYYKAGDYELASREFLSTLLKTNRADREFRARICYNIGNCEYFMNDLEKALRYFRKAIKLDPDDVNARTNYEFVLGRRDGDTSRPVEQPVTTERGGTVHTRPFMDERDRRIIYDMLDADERSVRKKIRIMDQAIEEKSGRNW